MDVLYESLRSGSKALSGKDGKKLIFGMVGGPMWVLGTTHYTDDV
jgi:hypothetical protein